jgi:L-cysteine desulfidase
MSKNLIKLLNEKLKPALGCTEPIAIALAGAVAMHHSQGSEIISVEVKASGNIIKNAMGVMLPSVNEAGIDLAATLGVLSPENHDLKLEVLSSVDEKMIDSAKELIAQGRVNIKLADTEKKLYIEVILITDKDRTRVIIEDNHTNITLIEVDDKVILNNTDSVEKGDVGIEDDFKSEKLTLEDIFEFIDEVDVSELKIIEDSIEMNKNISDEGLENSYGLEVARNIKANIEKGYYYEDIQKVASYVTAAGSDARMGGAKLAVMSNSGSGNQGIVATMPVVAVGEKLNVDKDIVLKGVALSHLISIYIKERFGVLSAFCGAVVAGIGASCGIVYILGGKRENIEMAINNMVGNITGIICDGAKPGCALKVAQVASTAVDSALLGLAGKRVSGLDGIVAESTVETLNNFTRLSTDASKIMDKIILDSMLNK